MPDAQKFACACSTFFNRFMCVMKRLPFTEKIKSGGVAEYHCA
jgi:hypothetical protein